MNKQAIKDVLYGSIVEMTRSRDFFYQSSVGHNYSHWTEEGQRVVAYYINLMTPLILEIEEKELDERAKNLVVKELKS
jgi:hypothetical protein